MPENQPHKLIKSTPREEVISKLGQRLLEKQKWELRVKLSNVEQQFAKDFLRLAKAHLKIGHISDLSGFSQEQLSEVSNLLTRKVVKNLIFKAPLELTVAGLGIWLMLKIGLHIPLMAIGILFGTFLFPLIIAFILIIPIIMMIQIIRGQLLLFAGGILNSAIGMILYSKNSIMTGLRFCYFRWLLKRHYGRKYFPKERLAN